MEDLVRNYLSENLPMDALIACDYSIFLNTLTNELFVKEEPTSNWFFAEKHEELKRIFHCEPNKKWYEDLEEEISYADDEDMKKNFGIDIDSSNMDSEEVYRTVVNKLGQDEVNSYNRNLRDQQIDYILRDLDA